MHDSIVAHVKIDEVYELVTGYRTNGRRHGDEVRVLCPRWDHKEADPSCDLNLRDSVWKCHACGRGGGIISLVLDSGYLSPQLHGNERLRAVYVLLEKIAGHAIEPKNLQDQPQSAQEGRKVVHRASREIYAYRDAQGKTHYEVVRINGFNAQGEKDKDIYGRVPLPPGGWTQQADGTWIMHDSFGKRVTIDGNELVLPELTSEGTPRLRFPKKYLHTLRYSNRLPFRLPEVLQAIERGDTIYPMEGEQKAQTLYRRSGLCTTTWYGGANQDPEEEWERYFHRAKRVCVLGDDDEAGRAATARRVDYFLRCGVPHVTSLFFSQQGEGEDAEDWLTARHNLPREGVVAQIQAMLVNRPWRTP